MAVDPIADFGGTGPLRPSVVVKGAAVPAAAPTIAVGHHPHSADALVLVVRRTTCRCGIISQSSDHRTFLRTSQRSIAGRINHFTLNRLDPVFTRVLPREIKVVEFTSEHCTCCWPVSVSVPFSTATQGTQGTQADLFDQLP
jgi:hypothetical protein